jgi:hypothetical protein
MGLMRNLRERDIERYFVRKVEAAGGVAEKFSSPNRRNVPDRIVLCLQPGTIHFVELKAPGGKASPGQRRDHNWRIARGFKVFVLDSYQAVDEYVGRYFE